MNFENYRLGPSAVPKTLYHAHEPLPNERQPGSINKPSRVSPMDVGFQAPVSSRYLTLPQGVQPSRCLNFLSQKHILVTSSTKRAEKLIKNSNQNHQLYALDGRSDEMKQCILYHVPDLKTLLTEEEYAVFSNPEDLYFIFQQIPKEVVKRPKHVSFAAPRRQATKEGQPAGNKPNMHPPRKATYASRGADDSYHDDDDASDETDGGNDENNKTLPGNRNKNLISGPTNLKKARNESRKVNPSKNPFDGPRVQAGWLLFSEIYTEEHREGELHYLIHWNDHHEPSWVPATDVDVDSRKEWQAKINEWKKHPKIPRTFDQILFEDRQKESGTKLDSRFLVKWKEDIQPTWEIPRVKIGGQELTRERLLQFKVVKDWWKKWNYE